MTDAALVTDHSLDLSGLAPVTEHFFKVRSCNAAALCRSSIVLSFMTVELSQTQFAPTDDATVKAASADTNFGTSVILEVDLTPLMHGYLKFVVSGTAGEIVSATVNVFNANASVQGGAIYHVTSTSWDESTITWNNKPAESGPALDTLGAVAVDTWYALDVTSAVTGDGTYSFVMIPTHTNGADYDSKEGTDPPYLELTFGTSTPAMYALPGVSSWGLLAMAALMALAVAWRVVGVRGRGYGV